MMRHVLFLTLCCAPGAAVAAEPATRLEAEARVLPAADGCLDHAVRELGMSAKRREGERAWAIGPQFLHPEVVAGGALEVRMEAGSSGTAVRVTASWRGGPKAGEVQREIEARLASMASKLAQICGVVRPEVSCRITPPGQPTTPCGP